MKCLFNKKNASSIKCAAHIFAAEQLFTTEQNHMTTVKLYHLIFECIPFVPFKNNNSISICLRIMNIVISQTLNI